MVFAQMTLNPCIHRPPNDAAHNKQIPFKNSSSAFVKPYILGYFDCQ